MELWCLLLALFASLSLLFRVSGKLPLNLWNISADVMMVNTASDKVSDMKTRSYLNLKWTERDESSKWLTNTCSKGAMHAFYFTILLSEWIRFFFFFLTDYFIWCYKKTKHAFYSDVFNLTRQKGPLLQMLICFKTNKAWSQEKIFSSDVTSFLQAVNCTRHYFKLLLG